LPAVRFKAMLNRKSVFKGQKGLYSTTEIESLPVKESPASEEIEKKFKELGFFLIGDLYCSGFASVAIYCFAQAEGNTLATIMTTLSETGKVKFAGYEFFSNFESGASLTTTITKLTIEDFKAQKIFRRSYPNTSPKELYQHHKTHIQELETKQGNVKKVQFSLEAIAASIDDYLTRQNTNSVQAVTSTLASYLNAIGTVLNKEVTFK
jgi:hypothetical protein